MAHLLHHIIDETALRYPDKDAFRFKDSSLSYAALAQRASCLALVLNDRGVRPGDRVGIYLRKSLETAVAVFGIMKAGAAYVPLDPELPTARLAAILSDADIRHVVTQDALSARLHTLVAETDDTDLQCLIGPTRQDRDATGHDGLDTVPWAEVNQASKTWHPTSQPGPDHMAYLMYTSGSTGLPKGIVHTHASGLSYARCAADVYELRAEDRLSGFPPLHFDQSTFDYFSGPLAGATTVIIPEAHMMMPASLSKLMEDERLSVWYSVPYVLTQLLLRGVLASRDLRTLRWVLFGGESFPPKHLRALMQQWPHARFSNVYGPAEVNQCTFYHVPAPPEPSTEAIPIGSAWPEAECLVLNGDRPVPEGDTGELVVRTSTMMQGYWNRPRLNAQAFYQRVHHGVAETFYRTGDLVRRDQDGTLWFLGRKDRQIKARGYRIELSEVETALLHHPDVENAAAYAIPDGNGLKRIEAVITVKPDASADPEAVRAEAARHLPSYALPATIDILDRFPRTSTGKIDHRALRIQAESAATASASM